MELKALVVEDMTLIRNRLIKVLEDNQIEVISAENIANAKMYLNSNRGQFDIILLDVKLPDGDCFELRQHIDAYQSGARVVICSGTVRRNIFDKLYLNGFKEILAKPISAERLQIIISEVKHANQITREDITISDRAE